MAIKRESHCRVYYYLVISLSVVVCLLVHRGFDKIIQVTGVPATTFTCNTLMRSRLYSSKGVSLYYLIYVCLVSSFFFFFTSALLVYLYYAAKKFLQFFYKPSLGFKIELIGFSNLQ